MTQTHDNDKNLKYQVKNLITKEILYGESVKCIADQIGCVHASALRLLKRDIKGPHYQSLKDIYINLFDSETFVLVDYDTEEEYECVTNATLFYYFNLPWNENISKHITAVKGKKQKILSFNGRVLYLKGNRPKKIRPQKSMTPAFIKQLENEKINQKIKSKLMCRINNLKRIFQFTRAGRTEEILGCKISEFKSHLESLFEEGMTWENHGSAVFNGCKSWHIDHIKPCNTFNLSDPEQQKLCFHYSNLRPLWESENLSRPKNGSDCF